MKIAIWPIKRIVGIAIVVFCAYLTGYWSSLALIRGGEIAVYRGGGQLLDYKKLAATECSAASVLGSESQYIENTVASLDRAVEIGVNILHINVHRTKDNEFVVFHDGTLDCATNGQGAVRRSESSDIIELDAAYNFTADGGKTYPFRGKGYKISLLRDVLNRYPTSKIWMNLKDNDQKSFKAFKSYLAPFKRRHQSMLLILSEEGRLFFEKNLASIPSISVESTKVCITKYILFGWLGIFPEECEQGPILLPPKFAKYIWGYPLKFASQAQRHGSDVFLWTKHTNIDNHSLYLKEGVGVVSGDLIGISKLER